MYSRSILISSLASLALAQSSSMIMMSSASNSIVSSGSATSSSLTPVTTTNPVVVCLSSCVPGDVNCAAICVGVPHPGSAQTSLTTECVAKCDQGDGSTAASLAYGKCRDACISSYIITMPGNTAAPGGEYTTPAIPGVPTTVVTRASSGLIVAAASSGGASAGVSTSTSTVTSTAVAQQTKNAASGNTPVLGLHGQSAAAGLLGVAMAAFIWL